VSTKEADLKQVAMSLGYSRDSLANLLSLANQDDNTDKAKPLQTRKPVNVTSNDEKDDGEFFYDAEESNVLTRVPSAQDCSTSKSPTLSPSALLKHEVKAKDNFKSDLTKTRYIKTNKGVNTTYDSMYSNYGFTNSVGMNTNASFGYNYGYTENNEGKDIYSDPYAVNSVNFYGNNQKKKSLLCCFFPFCELDADDSESESECDDCGNDHEPENSKVDETTLSSAVISQPVEVTEEKKFDKPWERSKSLPNDIIGDNENEEENEQLRVKPQSERGHTTMTIKKKTPNTLGEPEKGILKKASVKLKKNTPSRGIVEGSNRRNLFPTYQASGLSSGDATKEELKPKNKVEFQPMSRVVGVKSRLDMPFMEKCQVWWQKSDYDDFKKAARIIAKAVVQGGGQIWLQTSDSWSKKQGKTKNSVVNTMSAAYNKALELYGVADDDIAEEKEQFEDDKWWCKFGHSRRGLEHIVSTDEGRQRHKHVSDSILAVLEEQRRQRISVLDPQKLASVSIRHTSWARDLALAAAAADAEAVRSKFCNNAKSRIWHLHDGLSVVEKRDGYRCASFILSANVALHSQILDAHTSSSIYFRNQDKLMKQSSVTRNAYYKSLEEERKLEEAKISKIASGFGSDGRLFLRYKAA